MNKIILVGILGISISGNAYGDIQKSRTLDFDYEVTVKDIPTNASELKVWLPFLQENNFQIIEDVSINPSDSFQISLDKTYHNKILNFTLRPPFDQIVKINVHYKVKRLEYSNKPGDGKTSHQMAETMDDLVKFLKADRLVTLSDHIKTLAGQITKDKKTTIEKARAIYDYVFNNVAYNKEIAGWGYGDTERVCNVKAGNCTDFHSLFISLARASGIPAKFIMGVPLKNDEQGEDTGYHCWAEFYDEHLGWVPVDISEAWKDKTKYEYHFGAVDENRLEFTQGRDIILQPFAAGEPLNYFIYPYAEVDGKIHKAVGVLFKYKNIQKSIAEKDEFRHLTKK